MMNATVLRSMLWAVTLALAGGCGSDAARHLAPDATGDGDVLTLEYQFEDLQWAREGDVDHFSFGGADRYVKAGHPVIPRRPVQLLVPMGKRIVSIESVAVEEHVLDGVYRLPLGTKSRFRHPYGQSAPELTPTTPDPEIYSMSELWPVQQHRLVTVQIDRGYRVAHLSLFPLQFAPATGRVKMATTLRLRVRLAIAKSDDVARPTQSLLEKLQRRVDNPDALRSYAAGALGAQAARNKSAANAPALEEGGALLSDPANPHHGADYKYVVITNETLADENNIADGRYSFQALCESRTASGIPAGIVTTEWISDNYAGSRPSGGSDQQTRIRSFLADAYQTWGTEYALLAGDKDIIPIRLFFDSDYAANGDTYDIPTDMYYGCVDPFDPSAAAYAFDGDGDGKYGEFNDGPSGGEVDLTAEIFIGRAPVSTPAEVVNFVRKTLVYETIDDPYLNEAGTMGSHLGFKGIQEFTKPFAELIRLGSDEYLGHFTAGLLSPGLPDARDFNVTTLYDEDWYNEHSGKSYDSSTAGSSDGVQWDSGSMGWDAATTLVPYLNGVDGFTTPHLLYISDHGAWNRGMVKLSTSATGYPRCDHLGSLSNARPFFFYDDSCDVGAFDHADSFAEEITTMEHGAFACIVNAREGLGAEGNTLDSPSTHLTREFFHSVLGEGILQLGRAHQEAKESAIYRLGELEWSRYVYFEVTLFGDPAVRLRVTKPEDRCPDDPNKTAPGLCGCGVADDDDDADGVPNCFDACDDDPNKTDVGACGCGVADTDSDNDGLEDCRDGGVVGPGEIDTSASGAGASGVHPVEALGFGGCEIGCAASGSRSDWGGVVPLLLLLLGSVRRARRRRSG